MLNIMSLKKKHRVNEVDEIFILSSLDPPAVYVNFTFICDVAISPTGAGICPESYFG